MSIIIVQVLYERVFHINPGSQHLYCMKQDLFQGFQHYLQLVGHSQRDHLWTQIAAKYTFLYVYIERELEKLSFSIFFGEYMSLASFFP